MKNNNCAITLTIGMVFFIGMHFSLKKLIFKYFNSQNVRSLISPSASSSVQKKKVVEKRPMPPKRSINHATCDSCNGKGDLLNCARCPAAFHLLCW